ncbi:hypothetical protein AB6A40_004890 [Gnathostoma spinigerum]|uniref:glucuronosyltransferase n=1 Tax=Gnathostoma spinigerum TaxID=75299 RepID=A0ABD6EG64_9BILA
MRKKVLTKFNLHFRYTEAAKLMGDMLRKQPIKPEERLIKWSEFVAEFKTLDNLIPYGNQLNFIVYYCIDVILFLAFMIVFVLSIIFCISRCLLNFCCRKLKTLLSEKEKVN